MTGRFEDMSLPRNLEVREDGWASLQTPGQLYTQCISTCIGVSVYKPDSRLAMLGHFNIASYSNDMFDFFIGSAVSNLSGAEKAKVWVGGGQMFPLEAAPDFPTSAKALSFLNIETKFLRTKTLAAVIGKLIIGKGATLDRIDWLYGPPKYLNYSINTDTGGQIVEIKPVA